MKTATPDRPRRWPEPMGAGPGAMETPDLRPDRALPPDEDAFDAGEQEIAAQVERARMMEASR